MSAKPDLYGPFWIYTSLVLLLPLTSNLSIKLRTVNLDNIASPDLRQKVSSPIIRFRPLSQECSIRVPGRFRCSTSIRHRAEDGIEAIVNGCRAEHIRIRIPGVRHRRSDRHRAERLRAVDRPDICRRHQHRASDRQPQ